MLTALITGTSTGIGLETALAFARKDYRVFAGVRHPATASALHEAVAQRLPIVPIPLDVDRDDSVEQAVGEVLDRVGAVDVLVNNAGFGAMGPLELLPIETARALFETNYFGAIRMIRAVVPGMRQRRSGAIVNISSVFGRLTMATHGHYAATKFALEAATEALAAEMLPFGVRVALIEPGVIWTAIWSKGGGPAERDNPYFTAMRRLGRFFKSQLDGPAMPDTVAEAVLHAVETDRPRLRYAVGADAHACLEGRDRLSGEEWIAWQAEAGDEGFEARAREIFGADLYHPPSANSLAQGGLKPT
jgi:NAD(P)-dependent dehydrogenase (short-subunit alcohol dehydrogenase family)